ncbi:hypothetical protein COH20_004252 [Aspergillus flavus]|nr:hypothetical protein COH20_004252 [Aspergillus flavus]RAQ64862.1 hypothetical protein COH21_005586 [Aspergillus flavus]
MNTGHRELGPYGRACATCARAKCKCIPRAGGSSCERCHRLNKECIQPVRQRKLKPLSKRVQLEHKLDGLMTLLASAGQSQPQPQPLSDSVRDMNTNIVTSGTEPPYSDSGLLGTVMSGPGLDQGSEEEACLASFRTEKLPVFPVVHIPDTMSAKDFKQQSPFLWRCIATIQCKHPSRQSELCMSIREVAAKRLLVDCAKNLDLLQGVLMYLTWITYLTQPQKSSLCIYTQMAIGLVFELGLNKPAPPDICMATSNCNAVGHLPHLKASLSTKRTMNERRAVLGCYVLSSLIAQFLGRMDPLRWTPHMEECLTTLAESDESPNDTVLVQITRSRLLADIISQGPWSQNLYDIDTASRAPASFHMKAMQTQLQTLKSKIPVNLAENRSILFHLIHTEVSLYETALSKPATNTAYTDPLHLDHLYACLKALKAFFDLLVAIPVAELTSIALPDLIYTSHCLMTLFRLSTFDHPGWDQATVRGTLDLVSITGQLADRLKQVAQVVGIQNEGESQDPYSRLGMMMLKIRGEWVSRLSDLEAIDIDSTLELPYFNMNQWDLDSFLNWSGEFN